MKVSVIMPVRDGERFVDAAVASVLDQTEAEFELIVVDDGSTDSTPRILDDASIDPRMVVLRQPARGVSAARNHGLSHARGELIAFLDSDDVWLPHKLARQLELFAADPCLAVALTGYIVADARLRPLGVVRRTRLKRWLVLDGFGPALASTAMVRRSLVGTDLRFDESMSTAADAEFMRRVMPSGRIRTLPEPLAIYRRHAGQMSSRLDLLARNVEEMCRIHEASGCMSRREQRHMRANLQVHLMAAALRRRHPREAFHRLGRAMRLAPAAVVILPLRTLGRRLVRRAWRAIFLRHDTATMPTSRRTGLAEAR